VGVRHGSILATAAWGGNPADPGNPVRGAEQEVIVDGPAEASSSGGRRLWVIRHAKSDWSLPLPDFDRPLNKRGKRDAPRIGAWLDERGAGLELVLLSPARRTRQTWRRASAGYRGAPAVRELEGIYAAAADELLALVRDCPADVSEVAVVGHSPGCPDLVDLLTAGRGDPAAQQRMAVKYPTSAVAEVAVPGAWEALGPGSGALVSFGVPRG
jgi:phosphohistidine phosphatase